MAPHKLTNGIFCTFYSNIRVKHTSFPVLPWDCRRETRKESNPASNERKGELAQQPDWKGHPPL